ncbi:anti-sigma factor [Rhizobium sp. C1]|uniref:anti-sigma factor n=1 Tax=Rhizobium sp. C1 TaxID=1349799 RepID=UPI001E501366|nr:anti-sigma factor [Rhizobium sp. C1]MCD2179762.1 anti-sigma factor [Rhizobium sp. C1]
MTTPENKRSDRSRDEVLAGEYVLGVLSLPDRLRVEYRLRDDKAFQVIVARWQENLATFNNDYVTEVPPSWLYGSVETKLFNTSVADQPKGLVWSSLTFWRGLTLVSLSAAIFFAASAGGLFRKPAAVPSAVATLGSGSSSISLVTFFDRQTGRLQVLPVAAGAEKSKSLELWLIEGESAPVPLGVFQDQGDGSIVIPPDMRGRLKDGVTLAVSLEPFGGSPTGKPTGPVVASGKIGI